MANQCFSIAVPNTDVVISGGAGAMDGICLTTGSNIFEQAGAQMVLESTADMRAVTNGALGAVSAVGILIGTPATIQHSAGGGVQIYAGAGVSASPGPPGSPGKPFGASEAPKTGAGSTCDKLNAFNDVVKAGSDIFSGYKGMKEAAKEGKGWAKDPIGNFNTAFGMVKSTWDGAKAVGAKSDEADVMFTTFGLGTSAVGAANTFGSGDNVGGAAGALGFAAGVAGLIAGESNKSSGKAIKANYDKKLADATAANKARAENGGAGAGIGAPADGPRIHEVAPANIDRECGANMTALVGGMKETKVDGNIAYKSGGSVSIKAFSAVSTSSLTFSAHGNISASMKGLATAKVESLGSATLSGRAKFKVDTKGSGAVSATGKLDMSSGGKVSVTAGGVLAMKATGAATLHGADVGVVAKGQASIKAPTINLRGKTVIHKETEILGQLTTKKKAKVNGKIDGKGGATIKGSNKLG